MDVIPIKYPTSLQVEPVINTLNKEFEEIHKVYQSNPLVKFSEHTANYYN